MLQIYTGNGKGKTTAALGLAFRALGHKKKVLLIQFMKGPKGLGEIKAARRFSGFKILQTKDGGRINKGCATKKDKQLAQKGLSFAQKAIEDKKYDLVILDELNVALDYNLLSLAQVKRILQTRPRGLEIVITGRYANPELVEMADLVSEIREVKHYFKQGITCREGIEY